MLSVIMLSVVAPVSARVSTEIRFIAIYAQCCYTDYRYAECRGASKFQSINFNPF